MGRGLRVVTAIVAAIGVAQLAGGVALAVRRTAAGVAFAVLGGVLVVLAIALGRLGRRKPGAEEHPATQVSPIEIPVWSRPVMPRNGEDLERTSTWALLESMRAEAISEASDAAADAEARRYVRPRGLTPPE